MNTDEQHNAPAADASEAAEGTAQAGLRRQGAPREAVSEEIIFLRDGQEVVGWALNRSKGGMRVAFEDCEPQVGETLQMDISGLEAQDAAVVWVKTNRGGAIVGLAFGEDGQAPPRPQSSFPPAAAPASVNLEDEETIPIPAPTKKPTQQG